LYKVLSISNAKMVQYNFSFDLVPSMCGDIFTLFFGFVLRNVQKLHGLVLVRIWN
jgi:hypothetical protein